MPANRPLFFTVMNSVALFLFGLVVSQKGPSFNDLILISNTDVAGGSFYITASNFGSLLGSFLAGLLDARIKTKSLTIGFAMMLTGLFTTLTPWCSVFAAMLVAHGMVSVFSALYETIINTEEVQAWDGNSHTPMQFMSFCYSLGGVFGPLITEPFMAPKENRIGSDSISPSNVFTNVTSIVGMTFSVPVDGRLKPTIPTPVICPHMVTNCTYSVEDNTNFNASTLSLNGSLASYDAESNIQYAYLIVGATNIAMSITFCAACILTRSRRSTQREHKKKKLKITRKLPIKIYICLLGMACSFFYFHQMGTDVLGQYRFYFVVTHLDWSKESGAYLASMYWTISMCVKLALVAVYKRVDAGIVLGFSFTGIVIARILFCIAGYYHIHTLVWISSACMAVSQASVFGGSFSWTDGNLIKLDGKETSALMISGSLGALSGPVPLGYLIKNWSLMAFPYFVLCQLSISSTLFLIMIFVAKPLMNRLYGPLRPHIPNSISKEDTHEMLLQQNYLDENTDSESEGLES